MNDKKERLSVLLCLCMVLTLVLSMITDFNAGNTKTGAYFKLKDNIVMSGWWGSIGAWETICFKGTFDRDCQALQVLRIL